LSYFLPQLYSAGSILLLLLGIAILFDVLLLYTIQKGFYAERRVAERFSNGDSNKIVLHLESNYPFPATVAIIDELPAQFQERHWNRTIRMENKTVFDLEYHLTPLTRGEYVFHDINVFVSSPLRLVSRKYKFESEQLVKVYPSYLLMRRYQLLAISNRLEEAGVKKIRQLGHSMEFEQIKEYVRGDDYRTINWKATARKSGLMVNTFTDERSQQIYCIINKGRVMKMPFMGMYLLDYAINAALMLCNVALARHDRAGLITFAEQVDTFIVADKKHTQLNLVLESLYRQSTRFLEPDLEKLFSVIRNRITQRGLLVYFTNFESFESLERQLPSLKKIAKYHLLLVIIFENTELKKMQEDTVKSIEDIYLRTIADKFSNEKKRIVMELQKHGILSILTAPENLTVNVINKYLEIKNRKTL
jgi:uncharacterized protein (DUF58 family)